MPIIPPFLNDSSLTFQTNKESNIWKLFLKCLFTFQIMFIINYFLLDQVIYILVWLYFFKIF